LACAIHARPRRHTREAASDRSCDNPDSSAADAACPRHLDVQALNVDARNRLWNAGAAVFEVHHRIPTHAAKLGYYRLVSPARLEANVAPRMGELRGLRVHNRASEGEENGAPHRDDAGLRAHGSLDWDKRSQFCHIGTRKTAVDRLIQVLKCPPRLL